MRPFLNLGQLDSAAVAFNQALALGRPAIDLDVIDAFDGLLARKELGGQLAEPAAEGAPLVKLTTALAKADVKEGETVYAAAEPRERRRSRVPALLVLLLGIGLFAYAYRVDREAGHANGDEGELPGLHQAHDWQPDLGLRRRPAEHGGAVEATNAPDGGAIVTPGEF